MTQETPRLGFGTGWVPDNYDRNDKFLGDLYGMQKAPMNEVYQTIIEMAGKRTKVTLEDSCPPVYNQLKLGSCVANATAAALRFAWKNSFEHIAAEYEDFDPSRLWIYYYARLQANNRKDLAFRDTGCQIRNALKVLKSKGVCTEKAWPYLNEVESQAVKDIQDKTKDADAMPTDCRAGIVPPEANDEDVKRFFDFSFDYHRIRSLTDGEDKAKSADTVIQQMCACLAEGFPIIFGFKMYKEADHETGEFDDDNNWDGDVFKIQYDKVENRGDSDGGHAVLCVGYDSENRRFRVMNSWGSDWKGKGYFWLPFSWFEHAGTVEVQVDGKPEELVKLPAYDLWTVRPHLAPVLRDHDQ